jgi:flagellar biosynthetic protein FliR
MQPLILSSAEITAWIGSFLWPLIRVASMFSIAPVIGGKQIPRRIRIVAALLITLAIVPMQQDVPIIDPWSAEGVYVTAQQILIGLIMGFILMLVFAAVTLAGENIAMSMGLGFAMASDPINGVQVPVVSQFLVITASLLFLSMDGHLSIISMMATSFELLPIGTDGVSTAALWTLLQWAKIMFNAAASIALPAIMSLLTVNLVMGVMTRAAPQLNIFSVGFPMTMMAGYLILLFSLPTLLSVFDSLLKDAFEILTIILAGG